MMRLHWSPKSPYARKALMAGLERGLGARIERVRTPVPLETPNLQLLAINPLHKLPTLELDDGSVLYDSVNIAEYFDSLGEGPSLFGHGTAARWQILRRHALGNGFIDLLIAWRLEHVKSPERQSAAYLSSYELKTRYVLERLETDATALPVAIDIGQLATVSALGYLDYRFAHLGWRDRYPELAAWYARVQARPSVTQTPIEE
jgi:glutathione S-transferase